MNKIVFATCFLVTFTSLSFAQGIPTFASHSTKVEKVRNVSVDLKSHRDARTYRTSLRNAAKEGINFAGHFILTGWGCGTNCSQWAIIDARNGRVFFPNELAGVSFGFCDLPQNAMPADGPKELPDDASGPLYFRPNSRMVVLTGYTGGGLDNPKAKCGNFFFEWTGTKLRQLKLLSGTRRDTP